MNINVEDYFGTFPSGVEVVSTTKTTPVLINGVVYPHYPVIDVSLPKSKVATLFIDTVTMSNMYLKGLGGDCNKVSPRGPLDKQLSTRKILRTLNQRCDKFIYC